MGKEISLEAIEARAKLATPGPWEKCSASNGQCQCGFVWNRKWPGPVCSVTRHDEELGYTCDEKLFQANKDFIAHSREDVSILLDEVNRLRGRVRILRSGLETCATWRAGAHDSDDDMGNERRAFEDTEDWQLMEVYARSVIDRDEASQ